MIRARRFARAMREGVHLLAERRRTEALAHLVRLEAEGLQRSLLAESARLNLAIADLMDALVGT